MWIRVDDGQMVEQTRQPHSVLTDAGWVMVGPHTPADELLALGWHLLAEVPAPADGETTTHDRTIQLVDGVPTVVWVERPLADAEQTARTQQANKSTTEINMAQDLTNMQAIIDTTNATINSNPAPHIKNLARAMRRVLKHSLGDFATPE